MRLAKAINDCDDLAQLFAGWSGRIEQLSAGRFEGHITVVQGPTLRAFRACMNQAVLARGQDDPGVVSFAPVLPASRATVWQGRRLAPGDLVLRTSDVPINNRPAKGAELLSVEVHRDELRRAAWAMHRIDLHEAPRGWRALSPPPAVLSSLARRARRLLDQGPAPDVEADLLGALLAALPPIESRPGDRAPSATRAALARRGEELLRSRMDRPCSALELCQELGACDRTLRHAFRERFGLGPIAFHRVIRLNAARPALREAGRTGAGVADVARRFGFHHLGRFAADYARQFGELPSATRHAPATPPAPRPDRAPPAPSPPAPSA